MSKNIFSKVLILAAVVFAGGIIIGTAFAASTGPNNGSVFVNDSSIGSFTWSNTSNAQTSNGQYASVSLTNSGQPSKYLKVTGFGFSIPAGSTIDGISVSVERHQLCDSSCSSSFVTDESIKLVKNGVIGGNNEASTTHWGTSDTVATYGGSNDKWGLTWNVSDINSSSTGFVFAAQRTSGGDRTAYVDYVSMTVYYTAVAVPSVTLLPTSLPNGTVGTAYLQTLTASTTATGTFTWSKATGSLPAGLSLDTSATGKTTTISGTPSATGTSTFTIAVTNGSSSSTRSYTVGVVAAPVTNGTLVVKKIVLNNDGGTAATSSFSFRVNGGATTTFNASGINNLTVATGTYTIVETAAAGYAPGYSNCSGVTVSAGATTTCTITNDDINTPPVLSLPSDMTVEATGPAGATVIFSATATDGNPVNSAVSCLPGSGSVFAMGTTTVNCSASDASHATTTGSFLVTVVDTTKPEISGTPTDVSVSASGSDTIVEYTNPTASDVVSGGLTVACTPSSGSSFAVGTTPVTCTTTDGAGNTSTSTFNIIVSDTTGPVLTLPADRTVEATDSSGATVTFSVTATDLVDGSIIPSCSPVSGSTFALGTTTVSCSATDSSDNTSSGGFLIWVVDTTPPIISLLGDASIHVAFGSIYTDAGATASDSVNGDLTGLIAQSGSVDTSIAGTYILNYNVSDAAGNAASPVTRTVIVDRAPNHAPILSLSGLEPRMLNVGETYVEAGATASDPEDGDLTSKIIIGGDTVDTGTPDGYVVTYTVTDNDELNPLTATAIRHIYVIRTQGAGGGNGGGVGRVLGTSTESMGQVLGTSTEAFGTTTVVLAPTPNCAVSIVSFLRFGGKNNSEEVKKLQIFLNTHEGEHLPVTGVFGGLTRAAVIRFQKKYADQILKPWLDLGHSDVRNGTGYVYKTTSRWINQITCPALNLPIPELPNR